MLLASRSWLPVASAPPAWVTPSPLPEGEWEAAYAATLLATSDAPPVSYSLPSGSLPPGLTLIGDTISGTPRPAPSAPVWVTAAGGLGMVSQGGSITVTLAATGAAQFAIRAGRLPWGVMLDPDSGSLSGTLAVIGGALDDPGPPPVWSTPAGNLGTVREVPNAAFFPVSLNLAASGAAAYTIVGGVLPWGLTLDPATGALTGHAWNIGGGAWEPDTAITWSAPASANLGSFAPGASVGTIAQTVSLAGAFAVTAGVLPWGLTIVRGSGAISGTISAENPPGTYNFTVSCASIAGETFGQRAYSITIT